MATSSYTHRIDSDLRAQSEAIYSALGMSLGTAINVFLKKSVAVGDFPLMFVLMFRPRKRSKQCLKPRRLLKIPRLKHLL